MQRWAACAAIADALCIGIVEAHSATEATSVGNALVAGGLTAIGVAYTTPDASSAISALRADRPSAIIGAGAVLDAATVSAAASAGAQFIVSPVVAADVVQAAHRYNLAVLPSASTPTEIRIAMELGADLVGFCAAGAQGLDFMRFIATTMPRTPLVSTGGVTTENALEWLEAGALAVVIGGDLSCGEVAGVQERALQLSAQLERWASQQA